MSYSICYAMQAFCYPFPALLSDAKAWFEQQGGEINDHFYRDFEVRTGVRLPYQEDEFVVITEFGDSNVFDENGKRVRDRWASHGFLNRREAIRYLGIRWSEDVESGALKPGGRWSTAESWIKRMKQQIKHADVVTRLPYRCEKSFYTIETLSEAQCQLRDVLLRLDVKVCNGIGGEDQAFRFSLAPQTAFEWWLFSRIMRQFPERPPVVPMVNIDW